MKVRDLHGHLPTSRADGVAAFDAAAEDEHDIELEDEIAAGGQAHILRLKTEQGERDPYVLKLYALDEAGLAAMRAEHRALIALQGVSGVPRFRAVLTGSDFSFGALASVRRGASHWVGLKLSYIRGTTLESFIEHQEARRLTLHETAELGLRLLELLATLEERGIVHGDVNPRNIIIPNPGNLSQAHLVDFGFSRVQHRKTLPGIAVATPGGTDEFTPNEVLQGQEPSESSDLFGCVVTLYFACSGGLPFDTLTRTEGSRTLESLQHTLRESWELPRSVVRMRQGNRAWNRFFAYGLNNGNCQGLDRDQLASKLRAARASTPAQWWTRVALMVAAFTLPPLAAYAFVESSILCEQDEVRYDGSCVLLQSGADCPKGQRIVRESDVRPGADPNRGVCGCEKGSGWSRTKQECVNLETDPENCGLTGVICPDGARCEAGQCVCTSKEQSVCPVYRYPPVTPRGCFDLEVSKDNCGACGYACDDDEVCVGKRCVSDCEPRGVAFARCNDGCREAITTDACGRRCERCEPGQACVFNGIGFICDCPDPLVLLEGSCRDPNSDDKFCGDVVSHRNCTEVGGYCAKGVCRCQWPNAPIDGICRNVLTDNRCCGEKDGRCGEICEGDLRCVSGKCRCPENTLRFGSTCGSRPTPAGSGGAGGGE